VTNRDLLVRILRSPEFLAGETDTGFLDRHGATDPTRLAAPLADVPTARLHAVAAALALQALRRTDATAGAGLPSGWRNNRTAPQSTVLVRQPHCAEPTVVTYAFTRDGVRAAVDGDDVPVTMLDTAVEDRPDDRRVAVTVEADLGAGALRVALDVLVVGSEIYVDSTLGATTWHELPRLPDPTTTLAPGSLAAPMPGTVVRVLVTAGDAVAAGDPLVVLEAMKMEHPVVASADGVVTAVHVAVRDQVETGTVLAVVAGVDVAGD
jgi:propionyl-CoA carboxylase alpha chain